jgi:hypothetical protein
VLLIVKTVHACIPKLQAIVKDKVVQYVFFIFLFFYFFI